MNTADAAILAQQSMETLAKWWCILNNWDWPAELPNPEPPEVYQCGGRRSQIIGAILEEIGLRACIHHHNVVTETESRPRMTEEEFNDFWHGTFEGHEPSRKRYWDRLTQRIREAGLAYPHG